MIRQLINTIRQIFSFKIYRWKYKQKNKHNSTRPVNIFRLDKIKVGNYSYGLIDITDYSHLDTSVEIGHFCSIASGVKFILGGEHLTTSLSTFPFKAQFGLEQREAYSKGSIIVKDDVWIGANCLILSGVTIGQGAVLAAGSVVTKDIPPYAIVGGNPAKIIKYRFDPQIIEELIQINYGKITQKQIMENIHIWYENIDINNFKHIKGQIKNG